MNFDIAEALLNEQGVYVEQYGNGFMIADYRNGDNARYCGSDLSWRRQPITYCPFTDKNAAISAAETTSSAVDKLI